MALNILCIGDVVGRPGRHAISQLLPRLVDQYGIQCVIANVENAAAGSGLTPPLYEKFVRYGVHLMSLGDHIYKRREIYPTLEKNHNIVKPVNLPPAGPGRNYAIYQTAQGHRVALASVLGQLFMNVRPDSPFNTLDQVLGGLPRDLHAIVVDVHAEATSEKVALGWHLDGRVSCVFGTHTHIQTADEQILPQGTAYITDLGMTGPYDSVLGRRRDRVVETMRTGIPSHFDVATGWPRLCGVLVEIDPETHLARKITRLSLAADELPPDSADMD
ncbi:MAG: 2',3'-cyclic-nucleotide 2'-phosphodiesterase [Phycisphaerae bacterium]|nr:2',3'-cyclic-nucleotide 2'-phosphodiesterase [Phycisphaerae bacterium]